MSQRSFLPVRSDVIFALFFADERNIEFLTGFLQSCLRIPAEEYGTLEILDSRLLREYDGDKLGIVDVKLKTLSRKIIHIEIQLQVFPELKERLIYYDAKLITEQIGSGDDYKLIKKVISIIITEDDLIRNSPRYHHRFTFYDPDTEVEFSDLIEINTLELGKLPSISDGTVLYDWVRFIAAYTEEELEMVAGSNSQIAKAAVILRELSGDELARDLYERRERELRDERSRINGVRREIAIKAVQMNMRIEDITALTGLAYDEVEDIRAKAAKKPEN
ncbi:MAG: Rpn family recombination-promoting nuclease/putative transposase [Symbiobacteriaceae bacterium]|nr:Rpn family recombination-promoting nuclease/putative transposase [Symbiobacteriaceae bacterium]